MRPIIFVSTQKEVAETKALLKPLLVLWKNGLVAESRLPDVLIPNAEILDHVNANRKNYVVFAKRAYRVYNQLPRTLGPLTEANVFARKSEIKSYDISEVLILITNWMSQFHVWESESQS